MWDLYSRGDTKEDQVINHKTGLYIEGYMLCKEIQALESSLTLMIQNTIQMLDFLTCSNRSTAF